MVLFKAFSSVFNPLKIYTEFCLFVLRQDIPQSRLSLNSLCSTGSTSDPTDDTISQVLDLEACATTVPGSVQKSV